MSLVPRPWAADLLHLWFDEFKPADWFSPSDDIDALLRARFAREYAMLAGQPVGSFLASPRLTLAAILLFDQVPRNIYRGSARQFATDAKARALTGAALDRGFDKALDRHEKQFLAMPLMHSENVRDQQRALAFYARPDQRHALSFARGHARMIERFGRFPHRNEVLGRETTEAEQRAIDAGFAW